MASAVEVIKDSGDLPVGFREGARGESRGGGMGESGEGGVADPPTPASEKGGRRVL